MSAPLKNLKRATKKLRRRISYSNAFISAIATLGYVLIWLLSKTYRLKMQFHPEYHSLDPQKIIYAFWHGRQFLLIPNFGAWGITIMTDMSWAGDIQNRILRKFGYSTVRGSSAHHGVRALIQLKKRIQQGGACAFAVDGPRGPIYQTKPGVIYLAQKTGHAIVPAATSASKAWILKSTWCHYLLPKPFSKCCVLFGKPLSEGEDKNALSEKDVNYSLKTLTYTADKKMGVDYYPATRLVT